MLISMLINNGNILCDCIVQTIKFVPPSHDNLTRVKFALFISMGSLVFGTLESTSGSPTKVIEMPVGVKRDQKVPYRQG